MSFEPVLRAMRSAVSYVPSTSLIRARELRDLPSRIRRRPHEADFVALRAWGHASPTVVDVGANRGQSIRSLRYVLDAPMLHCCEPNPFLADHLRSAYDDDQRVVVHGVGLGATTGTMQLFLPRYGHTVYDTRASLSTVEAESFLTADSFLRFRPERAAVERVDVEISTLDELRIAPDLVKIDVEGVDDQVVAGGAETIAEHRPVLLVEFPRPETFELLERHGYTPYAFDPVAGRLRPGEIAPLNTFFLDASRLESFASILG